MAGCSTWSSSTFETAIRSPCTVASATTDGLPDGLRYVASWVTEDFGRCFQVMECEDRALLTEWIARWNDLAKFEIIPVVTSAEAAATLAPRL
jgi:uncharacterized protein DUF3303